MPFAMRANRSSRDVTFSLLHCEADPFPIFAAHARARTPSSLLALVEPGPDQRPALQEHQGRAHTERIVVDGVLDEPIWSTAPIGDEFVQNEPRPNEPATLNSSVRVVYDDVAIHVGAVLLDPRPDSIMQRLGARDDLGITDWFGITIDPYRSGRNGFQFLVSAANVQADAIVANEEEDDNWNAVWQSATRITEEGWIVEMTIPYSAFRFPKGDDQTWSVQFVRTVGRSREKTFWNPIDPLQEGWLRQCGTVSGIKDVQAPLRLMLYPYVSAYAQHFPQSDPAKQDWSSTLQRRHGCEGGPERCLHAWT